MAIVVWLVVMEALYVRALRVLGGRGVHVPRWQVACWHLGLAPPGRRAALPHRLALRRAALGAHGRAPPAGRPRRAAAADRPAQPRARLLPAARACWCRSPATARCAARFRTLRKPLVAIPVYVAVLYGWHLTFAFEGAVRHDLVHVLQHACFIFAGILVWWPALEPKRRRLRGELWKIGHIISARMLGMFLGHGLRADPRAGLHGRLRPRRAPRDLRAGRPADARAR